MRRINIHIGVLLALAIGMSACRTTSPYSTTTAEISDVFPNHTVSQILALLPRTPEAFDTLSAETVVAVSSPDENGRFSTRIAYRRDDSLLVRIRFPLGIEGARVLVTADSAWIFDRIHDEVLVGKVSDVVAALPGAMLSENLVDDALDFVQPDPNVAWQLSSDTLRYHLNSPDSTMRIVVDPALWRVIHIERKDGAGMVLEQRWYTDFRNINQYVLPLRMTVSRPVEDTRLSMVIRDIDTEPGPLSFELGLRRDTRRIRIGENE